MAIDTKNKRKAAIFPLNPSRLMLPDPDGLIGPDDRKQLVWLPIVTLSVVAPIAGRPNGQASTLLLLKV